MGNINGKNVLITGGTGFVGSNLIRTCIEAKANVNIISRESSDKWRMNDISNEINEYKVDLTDYNKLANVITDIEPSIIFHTATYGADPSQQNFKEIFETNFMGTANLLKCSKRIGFEMFVNTSSSSEYGIKSSPMNENDILEPINNYGISKAAGTLYCQNVAKKEELPLVILRLFSPYGFFEGPKRLIPSVILACLESKNPQVSSPDFVRDFIFIEDVLDVYIDVCNESNLYGEIFNVGSGSQHSVGEIVKLIIELSGSDVQPQWGHAPRWSNEPLLWKADIYKAQKILHWKPKTKLENGITKTINWFEKNLKLYH